MIKVHRKNLNSALNRMYNPSEFASKYTKEQIIKTLKYWDVPYANYVFACLVRGQYIIKIGKDYTIKVNSIEYPILDQLFLDARKYHNKPKEKKSLEEKNIETLIKYYVSRLKELGDFEIYKITKTRTVL